VTNDYAMPVASPPRSFASIAGAFAALPGARLLDTRDETAFARGHAEGAGRVSPEEFVTRRAELPSRELPVLVVHDVPERAREAATALAALGYSRVGWLERTLASEPEGHASVKTASRLWSPGEFIEREASRARSLRIDRGAGPGLALDLACGSGRAAVYLSLTGWNTAGWDVDPSALERARALAQRHGVAVAFAAVDLERAVPADAKAPFDLFVVVRFLHRSLFPWIERALAPGGLLLYETFRDGQQLYGHPRRSRFLLRNRELLTAFPSLLVEQHEETPDGAPPLLARLVARKPG